jgi:pilus assembly protein CpaB
MAAFNDSSLPPKNTTPMINLTRIVAVLLVLAALALGGYAWVLSRKPAPLPAPAAAAPKASTLSFPVVVTARAVPAGQALAADALRVEHLPINPPDAFQDVASATGRVPVSDLGANTPLLAGQLVSGLALHVAEGERAIAVKADEVMGVGNRVRPGDFVDVFFVLKSDGKDIDRTQARLLMPRRRVLAFGSASVDGSPAAADGKPVNAQAQRAEAARTVVLAVPVEDINRLALGEASGRLLLALRNPADLSQPDPALFAELPTALQPRPPKAGSAAGREPLAGIDRAQAGLATIDLVNGGGSGTTRVAAVRSAASAVRHAAAAPAAPRGAQVEIIRGDRRETVSY